MKIHILTEHIQKKILFLNRAISSKSQLPILNNILIETKEGHIRLSATDLEIGIIIEIPANIEKEGGTTVPARVFSDLIASLPQEKITLEVVENSLVITSKKSKSTIQTMGKDEFPQIYKERGEKRIVLDSKEVYTHLVKVVFAVSSDMGRPALSGILIKEEEKGLLVVATDGYRLSLKQFGLKEGSMLPKKEEERKAFLIPGRVIRELIALKEECEDIEVFISENHNQALFLYEEITVVGRLIEAEFPNYEKIIPGDFTTRVLFEKREMQQALKTASVFAKDTGNIVKFAFQKESIRISANTPSVGENTIEVESALSGDENEIAFNIRFVLELLGSLEEERVVFEMTSPLSPGVFKIEGDPTFLHIIMPIRVQSNSS